MTFHKHTLKPFLASMIMAAAIIPASARSHNYYIDPSHGNDDQNGHSESTAWKSFTPLQCIKMQPGDSLLLKRGTMFNDILTISAIGNANKPIVIDAYGTGKKPCIQAPDGSPYAVLVKNSENLTLNNLEITNTGSERMAGRTGIKILCEDFGVSHNIRLNGLYIHDVNGSLIKQQGGGSGILVVNRGKQTPSTFDGLTIENCVIRRCERNAMIWEGYSNRQNWHPSTNVVIRKNLIEEVPGDGIVPIGCEGAIVEYNLMRNCPGTLPHSEAAAGFWPWSCDNTILRFNEVSDHKAPWDAQGFDSDYNCKNTTIHYNYSHDNDGGMCLICNSGTSDGVGNQGSIIEYNVSINDAIRPRATRNGVFSANIHIGGPCSNTTIRRNLLHVNPKAEPFIDRSIITSDSWDGYADSTMFQENIFYVPQESTIRLTESTNNQFNGNYYLGPILNKPSDPSGHTVSDYYNETIRKDPTGFNSLDFLFDTVIVGDGATVLKAVNADRIHQFFNDMKSTSQAH